MIVDEDIHGTLALKLHLSKLCSEGKASSVTRGIFDTVKYMPALPAEKSFSVQHTKACNLGAPFLGSGKCYCVLQTLLFFLFKLRPHAFCECHEESSW